MVPGFGIEQISKRIIFLILLFLFPAVFWGCSFCFFPSCYKYETLMTVIVIAIAFAGSITIAIESHKYQKQAEHKKQLLDDTDTKPFNCKGKVVFQSNHYDSFLSSNTLGVDLYILTNNSIIDKKKINFY